MSFSNYIKRPIREGLVSGDSSSSAVVESPVEGSSGSGVEGEIYEWLGSDLLGGQLEANYPARSSYRKDDGWVLLVENRRARVAASLAVFSYRFGLLSVTFIALFKVLVVFGFLPALIPFAQVAVMGVVLGGTAVTGFGALCLLLSKFVAVRGERFSKRVVQLALTSVLLMNTLVFILLFSEFTLDMLPGFN